MQHIKNILLFFLVSTVSIYAQPLISALDSTYRYSQAHPKDNNALNHLNLAISKVYDLSPDTAFFYSEQQAKMASKLGNKELLAQAYLQMGKCMEFDARLDSSIIFYKVAEQVCIQHKLHHELLDVYDRLGSVYSKKGLMETSVEYALKAIDLMDLQKDTARLGIVYQNVALRYSDLGDYNESIRLYKRAIVMNILNQKTERLCDNFLNLGQTFYLVDRFDSSYYYYSKGLQTSIILNNKVKQVACYAGMAISKLRLQNVDTAQVYNDSTLKIAEQINDAYGYYKAQQIQGLIYMEQGDYQKAAAELEEALDWFEDANYVTTTLNILSRLSEVYEHLGEASKAYDFLKQYTSTKDSTILKQKDLAVQQVNHYRTQQQQKERELLSKEVAMQAESAAHRKNQRNALIAIGTLLFLLLIALANRYFFERKTKKTLHTRNLAIEDEKARSDELLLNILPEDIANELKTYGKSEARHIEDATVLFTDFSGFTSISESMTAPELVNELNNCFSAFDKIMEKYHIEKIKTIGDAYMAATGLHSPRKASAAHMVLAALEMQEFMKEHATALKKENHLHFEMRAGIHSGAVVSGIVGLKKFQYDIWGDTVNTASRMESNGEVGRVNISQATYELIKGNPEFTFESRGKVDVKGKGEMDMWFVSKN